MSARNQTKREEHHLTRRTMMALGGSGVLALLYAPHAFSDDLTGTRVRTNLRQAPKYSTLGPLSSAKDGALVASCPVPAGTDEDVTEAMNKWLAMLPNGFVADLNGGRYRCERPVMLNGKIGTMLRNGTLYRTDSAKHGNLIYPRPNPHIWVVNCRDVNIDQMTITGTNVGYDVDKAYSAYSMLYEFEAGIRVETSTGGSVRSTQISLTWGDGIQIHSSNSMTLQDCVIRKSGRQGITCNGSKLLIERIRVEAARMSALDFEPVNSTQLVGDIEVRNCYLLSRLIPMVCSGVGSINNLHFHDNVTAGQAVPIVWVRARDGARRSNIIVERHRAESALGSPNAAFYFDSTDHITLRDNQVPLVKGRSHVGVSLERCGGKITMTGNVFGVEAKFLNNALMPNATLSVNGLAVS